MKTKIYAGLLALAILLSLAIPLHVRAEGTRIDFTGAEDCTDDSFNFSRFWVSGPNMHLAGITQTCYATAGIPQMTGTDYLSDGRLVWNSLELSPISGKFRMESDEGGVWTGSWTLPANSNTIRIAGHGEGIYRGMQIFFFEDDLTGEFWGYILVTGN